MGDGPDLDCFGVGDLLLLEPCFSGVDALFRRPKRAIVTVAVAAVVVVVVVVVAVDDDGDSFLFLVFFSCRWIKYGVARFLYKASNNWSHSRWLVLKVEISSKSFFKFVVVHWFWSKFKFQVVLCIGIGTKQVLLDCRYRNSQKNKVRRKE